MKKVLLILFTFCFSLFSFSQSESKKVVVTGSVQSDMMIAPLQDDAIGTSEYDNRYFLTNTYADCMLQSKWVDAGARFELTQWPMPGFDYPSLGMNFKGVGVPNIWVKGKFKHVDVTLGSFYEQFGSGFILRTYEERTLGIDNSLLGGRFVITPVKGLTLKALAGLQRNFWKLNKQLVSGAEAEFQLNDYIESWKKSGTYLTLGLSWVNRYQASDDPVVEASNQQYVIQDEKEKYILNYRLKLPRFVNAFDARAKFQSNGLGVLGEFAWKSQDPNSLNSYIYNTGHAEMLSITLAKRGLSLLAQAKRSENMAFRSDRGMASTSTAGYINYQPAFTVDQTYALAALYPYATQVEGEWAYQGSVGYKFKGRYMPKVKLNYSHVNGLENLRQNLKNSAMYGTDGAKSAFWKTGDTYYQDADILYEQKINKRLELHAMYMYQMYNKGIIQGHGGKIHSHVLVADVKYKFNKRFTLRGEAQALLTKHESGNWGYGLLELSVAPYFMFTVSDQIGRPDPVGDSNQYGDMTHYYNFMVTGTYKSHRLQIGYGRTRAGINCSGGVCRMVPASKGVTINYNYNF